MLRAAELYAKDYPDFQRNVTALTDYSLDGQRLTTPVKGLNIVRYSDGTIKKEAVH